MFNTAKSEVVLELSPYFLDLLESHLLEFSTRMEVCTVYGFCISTIKLFFYLSKVADSVRSRKTKVVIAGFKHQLVKHQSPNI